MTTVVIAPDSFKGSVAARDAAEALAKGWHSVRPQDSVFSLPMADGGEGTLDVILSIRPDSTVHFEEVTGPNGSPVEASWLELSDSTAVIEMAQASGLPLMSTPDPIGATSRGVGELIAIAINHGVERILVGLGGSATTDAGVGALEALGAQIERDGVGAPGVVSIDSSGLLKPPREGITVLADTRAVFAEAPAIFAPQKGANSEEVAALQAAFATLGEHSPVASAARMPGSGAAGGTGWALASYLGAVIVEGSRYLGNMLGVGRLMDGADFVITGEGRLDDTSVSGKVVGHVRALARAYGVPGAIVVGQSTLEALDDWPVMRLVDFASSTEEATLNATRYLEQAGAELARTTTL